MSNRIAKSRYIHHQCLIVFMLTNSPFTGTGDPTPSSVFQTQSVADTSQACQLQVKNTIVPPQTRRPNQREIVLSTSIQRRHTLPARLRRLITTDAKAGILTLIRTLAQCKRNSPRGIEVLAIHTLPARLEHRHIPNQSEVHRVGDLGQHAHTTRSCVEDGCTQAVHKSGDVCVRPDTLRISSVWQLARLHGHGGVVLFRDQDVDGAQRRAPQLIRIFFPQRREDDLAINVLVLLASAVGQHAVLHPCVGEVCPVEQREARLVELPVPQQRPDGGSRRSLGDGTKP